MSQAVTTNPNPSLRLSVLVVSRTPALLLTMLAALNGAYEGPDDSAEVLCSWNGEDIDPQPFRECCRFRFHLLTTKPYKFSANMNRLAEVAIGDMLLLLNDDVQLDPHAVDAALKLLTDMPEAGIVGFVLRQTNHRLAHMGMNFDAAGNAYHVYAHIEYAQPACLSESFQVPAVTGASLLIGRADFLAIRFNEHYRVYGEDVQLCLDYRQNLGKQIWCCVSATGIHDESTTRKLFQTDGACPEDMARIAKTYQRFMETSDRNAMLVDLRLFQEEAQVLRDTIHLMQSKLSGELSTTDLQSLRLHSISEIDGSGVDDFCVDKGMRLELATLLEAKILAETKEIRKIRKLDNRLYEIHRQSIFTDMAHRSMDLDRLYLELDSCAGEHGET